MTLTQAREFLQSAHADIEAAAERARTLREWEEIVTSAADAEQAIAIYLAERC